MKYILIAAGMLAASSANALNEKTCESRPSRGAPPASAAPLAEPTPKLRVARFSIQGMLTKNCPSLIKAAVSRIPGVVRVEATFETRSATIEYRQGSTSPRQIQAVIKDRTGFDAKLVE